MANKYCNGKLLKSISVLSTCSNICVLKATNIDIEAGKIIINIDGVEYKCDKKDAYAKDTALKGFTGLSFKTTEDPSAPLDLKDFDTKYKLIKIIEGDSTEIDNTKYSGAIGDVYNGSNKITLKFSKYIEEDKIKINETGVIKKNTITVGDFKDVNDVDKLSKVLFQNLPDGVTINCDGVTVNKTNINDCFISIIDAKSITDHNFDTTLTTAIDNIKKGVECKVTIKPYINYTFDNGCSFILAGGLEKCCKLNDTNVGKLKTDLSSKIIKLKKGIDAATINNILASITGFSSVNITEVTVTEGKITAIKIEGDPGSQITEKLKATINFVLGDGFKDSHKFIDAFKSNVIDKINVKEFFGEEKSVTFGGSSKTITFVNGETKKADINNFIKGILGDTVPDDAYEIKYSSGFTSDVAPVNDNCTVTVTIKGAIDNVVEETAKPAVGPTKDDIEVNFTFSIEEATGKTYEFTNNDFTKPYQKTIKKSTAKGDLIKFINADLKCSLTESNIKEIKHGSDTINEFSTLSDNVNVNIIISKDASIVQEKPASTDHTTTTPSPVVTSITVNLKYECGADKVFDDSTLTKTVILTDDKFESLNTKILGIIGDNNFELKKGNTLITSGTIENNANITVYLKEGCNKLENKVINNNVNNIDNTNVNNDLNTSMINSQTKNQQVINTNNNNNQNNNINNINNNGGVNNSGNNKKTDKKQRGCSSTCKDKSK